VEKHTFNLKDLSGLADGLCKGDTDYMFEVNYELAGELYTEVVISCCPFHCAVWFFENNPDSGLVSIERDGYAAALNRPRGRSPLDLKREHLRESVRAQLKDARKKGCPQ